MSDHFLIDIVNRRGGTRPALHDFIALQFRDLVRNPLFPCTIARGSAAQDRIAVSVYDDLSDPGVAVPLLDELYSFIDEHPLSGTGFHSFAALFAGPAATDEARFEALLWSLLQRLHELDRPRHRWDPSVDADPASDDFSFSLGGRAFFLVGMHPGASRHARRFAYPAIMFNMHAQFEALRAKGSYDSVRDRIRGNDMRLQGSIHPSLDDHGAASEARQYSGRAVEADWVCPFRVEPADFAGGAA